MSQEPKVTRFGALPTVDSELATKAYVDSSGGGGFWSELGRDVLTVAGDTLSVDPITAMRWLWILLKVRDTGGTIEGGLTFNGDTGANYAYRERNDNTVSNHVNQNDIDITHLNSFPAAAWLQVDNSSDDPKLINSKGTSENTTGAGSNARQFAIWGKWQNNTQVTRVDVINGGTGDFDVGSLLVVLGAD